MARGKNKGLKVLLFTILSLILIVVIAVIVFLNLTPRTFGLETQTIGGKTIEQMEVADIKFFNIIKSIRGMNDVKEDEIIVSKIDENGTNAESKLAGSNLASSKDYKSLLTNGLTYNDELTLEFSDKTLGYMLNEAVKIGPNGEKSGIREVLYMQDYKLDIKEFTITKAGENGKLRIVASMDTTKYKEDLESILGFMSFILDAPESVYLVLEYDVTASDNAVSLTNTKMCINDDTEDVVVCAILNASATDYGDGGSDEFESLKANMASRIAKFINSLGKINALDNNKLIINTKVS